MARIIITLPDAHIQRILAAYKGIIPTPIPNPPDPNAVRPNVTVDDIATFLRAQVIKATRDYEAAKAQQNIPEPAAIP